MEENEIIRLKIDSFSSDASGVARLNGIAVFVEEGVPGDEVEAEITVLKKNYAKAKTLKIIKSSSDRTEPPCRYFHLCGACQMQHIKYPAQLKYKTQIVKDNIKKIGGSPPEIVADATGAENLWGYRNKMQYPVRQRRISQKSNDIDVGYYKKGTHEVVDIDECIVLHPFLNKIASAARKAIKDFRVPVYDEDRGRGLVRHILARAGFRTREALLCFIINGDEMPGGKNIAKAMLDDLDRKENEFKLKGIVLNSNNRRTNVILGEKTRQVWGTDRIKEDLGSLRFNISAASFFQINPAQTEVLYNTVKEFASLTGIESVIDVYSGTGSISLWLAKDAKEVYGIEEAESAVGNAKENAGINNIKNVFFKCGEAGRTLKMFKEAGFKPDLVVLDPPRSGCCNTVLESVKNMSPKKLIYVSCDPATLSRDLKILNDRYEVKRIQPVDMFPQTVHIECVAQLQKKN
ncbi:MAG: 23S rRNA (uracil(1939)-C(5))-methyltransferase RlmD [Candidatus Saganbacteria bacterium]|nr:23S rRNA (uracil(1939)-C(5))-methyltransferase RlmD [Candidatus Saganbacteria bacterium]